MSLEHLAALADAMWEGDTDLLHELAPCRCCCDEHTFADCAARAWNGCRGQYAVTWKDTVSWERHYATHHGMTAEVFYGWESAT